jgi:hypothetical protein
MAIMQSNLNIDVHICVKVIFISTRFEQFIREPKANN